MEISDRIDGDCPAGFFAAGSMPAVTITINGVRTVGKAGHPDALLWPVLHNYAATYDDGAANASASASAWLVQFAARVSCGQCRTDWGNLIATHPPDLTSRDAFFIWTWMIHEAINKRLGKTGISLEDARGRYLIPHP